ncbi:MAG: hypothetical protein IJ904_02015 [Candidatus Methanomethylophilaceae archaeon]|nr:hypothetical protein [Candidatus Methanomethylophilaceae archaeon]
MISEKLQTNALHFLDQVVSDARSEALKSAKEEFDKQKAQMQADFDRLIAGLVAAGQQEPAPTENLVFSDGADYTIREARLVASFSYSRKFASTKWGTIVLPVALDYEDWASRFEIAEIADVTVGSSISTVRQVLGPGSQTIPGHPYQIRAKVANSTKPQAITKRNCKVFPAEPGYIAIGKGGKTYRFCGTYTTMSVTDLKGKYYASNGSFVPAKSICKPMRVYLEISE